jgi:hypothetical protein
MNATLPPQIQKTPYEQKTFGVDWTAQLRSGVTVSSGTFEAWNITDHTDASTGANKVLEATAATISGNEARCRLIAGVDGKEYKITSKVTLSNGDLLESSTILKVRA